MNNQAVVLFSGGIDSTTSLYWSMGYFDSVVALVFDYSQVHRIEVNMAETIARMLNVKYHKVNLPLIHVVSSALIDREEAIPGSLAESKNEAGIPITYVPFRNGIFISVAAAFAETRQIYNLVTGFNLVDSPDYPDTTAQFTKKMEAAMRRQFFLSSPKSTNIANRNRNVIKA